MAIVIIRLIVIIIDTKQYDNMILVPFGEPLGASVGVLEGSWGAPRRESGGVWGGLGAPCGGSGAVLERSWRPSCGNMIFGRFLVRFGGRFGRPRGWEMEPKLDPDRTQIEDGKEDAKRSASKSSWGGPGEVLEPSWNDLGPSWPNLRPSWDDLEAAGGAESLFFLMLFNTF